MIRFLSTIAFLAICVSTNAQVEKSKNFEDNSGKMSQVAVSPDNQFVAAGNELGIVTVWDRVTGEQKFKTRPHRKPVNFIFFHPSKEQVITADVDGLVFLNLSDGKEASRITIFAGIDWVEVNPNGEAFYVLADQKNLTSSRNIYSVDLVSRRFKSIYGGNGVTKFVLDASGERMYIAKGTRVYVNNVSLEIEEKVLDGHDSKVRAIDANPFEEGWLLTSDRYLIRYWQVSSGKSIPFPWASEDVYLLSETKLLLVHSNNMETRDTKALNEQIPINTINSQIKKVVLSHDRSVILTLGDRNVLEVWDNKYRKIEPEPEVVAQVEEESRAVSEEVPVEEPKIELPHYIDETDRELYTEYKNEIDAEINLKSELFVPRGEFEKSTDYEARQAEAKSYKQGILAYYQDKLHRSQALERQLELAKQRYLDSLQRRDEQRRLSLYREKIVSSYEEFNTSIESIGTYNADNEFFPVTIDGKTRDVYIPISKAPAFKQNFKTVKVIAARQLKQDAETMEVFNVKIITPEDKEVYEFGRQREPLYVDPSKTGYLLNSIIGVPEPEPVVTRAEVVEEAEPVRVKTMDERIAEYLGNKSYYALIIGVNDYLDENINKLDEPINDALRLKRVLKEKYTFEEENITLLRDPTRAEIIEAFDDLAGKVQSEDNLLIFYAGHGVWDERLKQGYWLPRDSKQSSKAAWLSNGTIRDYIGGIKSRHTLLVADACFSGGIFKTRDVFTENRAVLELYKLPSRKAMTSGNMKTVPDKSVFMEYLIRRLNENEGKMISAEQLFSSFRVAVINNSANGQVPQFGDIRETGDEGGDFVFLKRE